MRGVLSQRGSVARIEERGRLIKWTERHSHVALEWCLGAEVEGEGAYDRKTSQAPTDQLDVFCPLLSVTYKFLVSLLNFYDHTLQDGHLIVLSVTFKLI